MQNRNAASIYKRTSLETATPGRLILMLYDGALKFIDGALDGFKEEEKGKMNERVHNNIQKTLDIIVELRACIDHKVEGEFSKVMNDLYLYMESLLV